MLTIEYNTTSKTLVHWQIIFWYNTYFQPEIKNCETHYRGEEVQINYKVFKIFYSRFHLHLIYKLSISLNIYLSISIFQCLSISITPEQIQNLHILNILISSDVIWCHIIHSDVIWCHWMSSDAIWCHLLPSVVIWCHLLSSVIICCHLMSLLQDLTILKLFGESIYIYIYILCES